MATTKKLQACLFLLFMCGLVVAWLAFTYGGVLSPHTTIHKFIDTIKSVEDGYSSYWSMSSYTTTRNATTGKVTNHHNVNSGTTESVTNHHNLNREATGTDKNNQTTRNSSTIDFRKRFIQWEDFPYQQASLIGPDHVINKNRFLIYRCGGRDLTGLCGGWSNRVNGMLLAYLFANMTGRVFKIAVLKPHCDIHSYVQPNLVDWSTLSHLHTVKQPKGVQVIKSIDDRKFYNSLKTANIMKLVYPNVSTVYFTGNLEFPQFVQRPNLSSEIPWMTNLTYDRAFAILYKRIFALSVRLKQRLQKFMQTHLPTRNHRLICAQMRLGRNPDNPQDSEIRLDAQADFPKLWEFLRNHSKTDLDKIFLMSDSDQTIEAARKQHQTISSRLILTPGFIVHTERGGGSNVKGLAGMCEGFEKVIFDQHVLMNCDVLLLSKSGLGRTAAYVRGSDHDLYCLRSKIGIKPCKMKDLFALYN